MLEKLKEFLAENYDMKADDITLQSEIGNDLGISSFQLVEMCSQLEEEFEIEINEDEMTNIITIGDLIALIEKEIKNK